MSTPAQKLQSERLKYPGLLPREVIVLRNWLQLHEGEFDRFAYNVRLGGGFDPGPTFDSSMRAMAIANTQKRVDAVAFQGGAEWRAAFDASQLNAGSLAAALQAADKSADVGELVKRARPPSGFSAVTLIEVKDRAGYSAVGQLVGYNVLWRAAYPNDPPPALLMVANIVADDVVPVLASSGIQLALVPSSFGELRRTPTG